MHDYMRALRQRFDTPPKCEKLKRELEQVHADLHERLGRQERKLLLRVIDLQCSIQDETSLHSFIAGFRLAEGIKNELDSQPAYSFDKDEERRARAAYVREREER